jgi:hypothetical protein
MSRKRWPPEGVDGGALQDPRDMAKAGLPETQSPCGVICITHRKDACDRCRGLRWPGYWTGAASRSRAMPSEGIQGGEWVA